MAVPIQYPNKAATSYVSATSRYATSTVILIGEQKKPAFELYKKKDVKFLMQGGVQWTEILPPVEYRPDLVSYELYGTPDFWWRLMELNNMKDILEFKAGRVIMVPDTMVP